jgi:predicted RNA binding protein YcfA (HicA-like mRNA interferase family)
MPKTPRGYSGNDLVRALAVFGYIATRQTGSHIRLTSAIMGSEHHVTVPAHDPRKVGTLNGILGDISTYLGISKAELLDKINQ